MQLHLHFIAHCNVSALGSRIERIKMVIAIQMRDVLFSLFFFLPLSSLSLYLFSSLYPGSGMRLLCPRFLSFILDSRWDVQRSCYNVADCRLALVLWWRRGIATAPLRLNCVDWRAVTHLRSNILELEIFVLENVIAVICDHYSHHFRDM